MNTKYIALILASAALSSCCAVCTKEITATPTIEDSKDTSKKSLAFSVKFEECRDRAICEAVNNLNKNMDKQTKWFEKGTITWAQYSEAKDRYFTEIKELTGKGTIKDGGLAAITLLTKSTERETLSGVRGDLNSSKELDQATAARIQLTAEVLSEPLVAIP